MKICLGMIFKNEEDMLRRNLRLVAPYFDGVVIGDDNSTDGSFEVLEESTVGVVILPLDEGTFADKRNEVIEEAEDLDYDAIVFLDADESMFSTDIELIQTRLKSYEAIAMSRYEFGPDVEHYNPKLYPDFQGRAFVLNKGYHYEGDLHETLFRKGSNVSVFDEGKFYLSKDTPIFHYGRCKSKEEIWLRYHNYNLIKEGKPTIDKIPEGVKIDLSDVFKDVVKFDGRQPE